MKGKIEVEQSEEEIEANTPKEYRILYYKLERILAAYLTRTDEGGEYMILNIGEIDYPVMYDKKDWEIIKKYLNS